MKRFQVFSFLTVVLSLLPLMPASGSTLYWDADGDGSNGAGGGTGAWDVNATANWYPGSGPADVPWPVAGTDDAVFGPAAGTVTLAAGGVSAGSLAFTAAGYTVTGSTLTLTGPAVTTGGDATISSVIAGSAGLLKSGAAILSLNGAGTFSGEATISQGTVQFGVYNALGGNTVTLGDASTGSNDVALLATFASASNQITNPIVVSSQGTGPARIGTTFFNPGGVPTLYSGLITLNRDTTLQAGSTDRTTFLSKITGTGNITIDSQNNGRRITFDNNSNDFVGSLTVNANTIFQINGTSVIPDASNVTVNGTLYFNSTGETINGLNGSGTIQVHPGVPGSATLTVGSAGADGTFTGLIQNGGNSPSTTMSLRKIGLGTQTMTGSLNYTGTTTVDGGVLQLAKAGVPLDGGNGQFGSGSTVTVNSGGTLELVANWVAGGGSANKFVANGGTIKFSTDNYMNNIEMTGGAVLTSGGTFPWRTGNFTNGLIKTNASSSSSTISGSLAFVKTLSATNTTFDVADGAAANDLVVSSTIFDHPGGYDGMVLVKTGPGRMVLSGASTWSGGLVLSQGTLYLDTVGPKTAAGAGKITLGDANTGSNEIRLEIPSSTVWGPNSILNNAIDVSNLAGGRVVIAHLAGTALAGELRGLITLQNKDIVFRNENADRLSVASKITGTGNVTFEGTAGRTTLGNNSNDFIGDVTIAAGGNVQIAGSAIPATSNLINNGGLWYNNLGGAFSLTVGGLSGSGSVLVNWGTGDSTLVVGNLDRGGSYSGTIQNGGSGGTMGLTKIGAGTQTLTNPANSYTGGTIVNGGTLRLAAGDFNNGIIHGWATISSGATLDVAAVYPVNGTDTVTINGGGTLNASTPAGQDPENYIGTVNLDSSNGLAAQVTTTSGSGFRMGNIANGFINSSGPVPNVWSAELRLVNGGGRTETINTAAGNTLTISGAINAHTGLDGTPIFKTGPGTLILSGANTYAGPTTINGGTLLVNGANSGTGAYSVASGATLGGNGSISGPVTAQPAGHIAPGTGPGTLRTASVTMQPGSFFDVELGPSAGDMLDVIGSVNVTDAWLNLIPLSSFSSSNGSQYLIVQNDGSDPVTGRFQGLPEGASLEAGGAQFSITYFGGTGSNDIVLSSVPEPCSAALVLIGLAAAGWRTRRRIGGKR